MARQRRDRYNCSALQGAYKEMILQAIPAAATTIKEMLNADPAASSQAIDDVISRYLRVRGSSAIDKLEHELTAIFLGGVIHAVRIVTGLEALGQKQETHVAKNPAGSRIRATFRDNRPRRFPGRIGAPVNP
jgi:hypothetical protein